MFGLFRRKSEIKALIEKRSEELRQEDAIFYEYSTMFAASSVELSNKNSNIYFIFRHEKVLRSLKYLEHIIPSDSKVPISRTLGYDTVLYLKAFLYTDDPEKKNAALKDLDEHITDLGEIIEACSHGQATAYPVIVEWLFAFDTETAKQLLATAAQNSR
jgi:hypothetical protein